MKIQDQSRQPVFNSLQKRLKMLSDVAADAGKLLSENLKGIDLLPDKDAGNKIIKIHIADCKNKIPFLCDYCDELYDEAEKYGLANKKMKDSIDFIKSIMEVDINRLPQDDCQEYYKSFLKALSLFGSFELLSLEQKQDNAIFKYLKKTFSASRN